MHNRSNLHRVLSVVGALVTTFGPSLASSAPSPTAPSAEKPPAPSRSQGSSGNAASSDERADSGASSKSAENRADEIAQAHASAMAPGDLIEASPTVPPSTIEVTTLDPRANPVAGVQLELVRDRQSVAEGNSSTKWKASTDVGGRASFSAVPPGSDSHYRVVVVDDGKRYGTRPFPLETRFGTKVVLRVYPLVRDLKQSLVAGRGFVFIEPRDEVLSIEYMQQFHNLGQTVFVADDLELDLPKGWKAFATNATDPDLSVTKTDRGVKLLGVVAPGQHSVAFTFQVPTSNNERIQLDLDLWPNTAEAQVATVSRPGLELSVSGFPNSTLAQGNGRVPFLVTGRSFTRDGGPPTGLDVEIAGLPVIGPGRWVAALSGAILVLGALALTFRRGERKQDAASQSAARARIVDELATLERAHREGKVGEATYADTREALLAAFVRIEREGITD